MINFLLLVVNYSSVTVLKIVMTVAGCDFPKLLEWHISRVYEVLANVKFANWL